MDMCNLETHENISDMRKKSVIDSNGVKVGHIIDVIFDENYKVKSFIIGGSFWEEFRESLGIIDDIDPIIPANNIVEIKKNKIILDIPKNELHHKLEKGEILPTDNLYSIMKRKNVFDHGDRKIGQVCNLIFLPCGEVAFILSCKNKEENIISKGFGHEWDLLLPSKFIEKETLDNIKIKLKGHDLERTLDKHLLDNEKANHYLNSLKHKNTAELRALLRTGNDYYMR